MKRQDGMWEPAEESKAPSYPSWLNTAYDMDHGGTKERVSLNFQALFDKSIDKSDKGLAKAFEKIDTNGNGTLDAAEIRAFITKAYLRITGNLIKEQMLTDMMSAADADGNGEVDLEEFKVIMRAGGDAASRDSSPARPRPPVVVHPYSTEI